MSVRTFVVAGVGALALAALPAVAQAGDSVSARIPVAFVASGQTHAPGTYELRISEDEMTVELDSPTGPSIVIPSITRLASNETQVNDCRVVLDKVGKTYYLSEVWVPGMGGFRVYENTSH